MAAQQLKKDAYLKTLHWLLEQLEKPEEPTGFGQQVLLAFPYILLSLTIFLNFCRKLLCQCFITPLENGYILIYTEHFKFVNIGAPGIH